MGVKRTLQGWGTLLSFLANVFTILSTVTSYWIRHAKGHGGLWQECTQGLCSSTPCQPTILMAGLCMVLSGSFGVVATVMGLRLLCRAEESLRGQLTSVLLFVSGWLALPFSVLAGGCFLLADLILQSSVAISSFPVCL
ncbi:PREDICTED: claudin domain-containing protein 2 isoform X3 [Chinchilla lanigera]|uniref:claudin domain-containing protein 2 isoform X3 n=1 Tax=Chinchilla lanigera TaxID=34839 RepID=UPI00069687A1|nr:PREDICTED: claudin domain-containing protein 2 isoform X3 [Chinchilla lanigera]